MSDSQPRDPVGRFGTKTGSRPDRGVLGEQVDDRGQPCGECGADTKRQSGLCRRCNPSSKRNKRAAASTSADTLDPTPQPTITDQDSIYGAHVTGGNFDPNRNITEISKAAKARFRVMQKSGDLPPGWKIRSKLDRYSGGQAIRLTVIVDEPAYAVSPGLYHNDADSDQLLAIPRPGDPAATVDLRVGPNEQVNIRHDQAAIPAVWNKIGDIKAHLDSFNKSQNNSMVDYHNNWFHGFVSVEAPDHPPIKPEFRPTD